MSQLQVRTPVGERQPFEGPREGGEPIKWQGMMLVGAIEWVEVGWSLGGRWGGGGG